MSFWLPLLAAFFPMVAGATEPGWGLFATGKTAQCEAESTLKAQVARMIGRDPFSPRPAMEVQVHFDGSIQNWTAEVVLRNEGRALARRTLTSDRASCSTLVDAVVLHTAMAIDPLADGVAPADSTPAKALTADPQTKLITDSVAAPLPPAPATPVVWSLAVGGIVGWGLTPGLAGGVSVAAVRESSWWSIRGGGRTLSASAALRGGQIRSTGFLADTALCLRGGVFSTCGVLVAGVGHYRGADFARNLSRSTFVSSAGGRLALRPRFDGLFVELAAEGLRDLTPVNLTIDRASVWRSETLQLTASVSLGFELDTP